MKLPKNIVDEFVSWIDLKDVQEYVEQNKTRIKLTIYGRFKIQNTKDFSFKKQKIFKTSKNNYIIWNSFPY